MAAVTNAVSSIFAPPPPPAINIPAAPPPPPNVADIQQTRARQEALSRKKMGKDANLLTGALGDTSTPQTSKTLLGQ